MANYTLLHKINSDLFIFGEYESEIVGLDNDSYKNKPTLIVNDINCETLWFNYRYSLIYKINDGTFISNLNILSKNVKMYSYNMNTLISYMNNGDVFVIGDNYYGQLGLGDFYTRNEPTLLMNDRTIKLISCGGYHCIIYKENGDLLVFGNNNFGQLGFPFKTSPYIGVDKDNRNKPTLLMNDIKIKMISCGLFHSMIYKQNGDLLVFGYNWEGQLGLQDNNNRYKPTLLVNDLNIKLTHCCMFHSVVYTQNGDLFTFGRNDMGQLGLGDNKNRHKPTFVLNDPSIIRINDKIMDFDWSPDSHKWYPNKFKDNIILLYKCLKQYKILTGVKIPKFIIYEIIKFISI